MRKLRDLNGRFRLSRKAVSPVIATLLMIAIAVAAAILVYVWSMGLIGGLQTGGGQQVREQVEMDEYSWTAAGTVTLYVRNVGNSKVNIAAAYVEGHQGVPDGDTSLDPLASGTVTVALSAWVPTEGVAYTLKVVTKTGGVFSFSIIYGHGA